MFVVRLIGGICIYTPRFKIRLIIKLIKDKKKGDGINTCVMSVWVGNLDKENLVNHEISYIKQFIG